MKGSDSDKDGPARRTHYVSSGQWRIGRGNQAFLESSAILRDPERNPMVDPAATLRKIGGRVDLMARIFLERPEAAPRPIGGKSGSEDVHSRLLDITAPGAANTARDRRGTSPAGRRSDHHLPASRDGRRQRLSPGPRRRRDRAARAHRPAGQLYEKLCNLHDPTQAMTPHETLSLMFGRNRGKFDTLAHEWPARRLGAHPPGSTRVMAHGGNVPREEAIRLDPERETGIAIAMRPVMTRPAAAACPMPRERMIHYFNGAVRPGREEAA